MKMKPEHFTRLHDLVTSTKTYNNPEAYVSAGLSDRRWRWDCIFGVNSGNKQSMGNLFKEMYMYLNDDHIDTALRRITGDKWNETVHN